MQIQGPSPALLDDVVLELKEVRDLSQIGCIKASGEFDPYRVLLGQARISSRPSGLLGYMRMDDLFFWIHAWVYNYHEIELGDFSDLKQLSEIVFDVGVQLGRGQPKQIADPFGWQLRRELVQALDRLEPKIIQSTHDLKENGCRLGPFL